MNLTPLTKWERIVQWFQRYAPIPWKKCMVCGTWFYNPYFYSTFTWWWGMPDYCSQLCAEEDSRGAFTMHMNQNSENN